jgi:hypothetical protein
MVCTAKTDDSPTGHEAVRYIYSHTLPQSEKMHESVKEKGLDLTVGYVDGDNIIYKAQGILENIKSGALTYLDAHNEKVQLADNSLEFLDHPDTMPVVCANAYLGYRAIKAQISLSAGAWPMRPPFSPRLPGGIAGRSPTRTSWPAL